MKGLRKLFGLLIALVGIVALIAVIWSTGTARVAMKPSFFAEVPQLVIKELPEVVDKAYVAAQQKGALRSENARDWIAAASKVESTPNEVFRKMGLYKWLQEELSTMLTQLNKTLRGEGEGKDIVLDFTRLKKALQSPVFHNYVRDVLKHLEPCKPAQAQVWSNKIKAPREHADTRLPACNPGLKTTQNMLGKVVISTAQIPDRKVVLKAQEAAGAFVGLKLARVGLWFLFLIPLILLGIASGVGGTSRQGRIRWFGVTTLIGGLLPLMISWFLKDIGLRLLMMNPAHLDLERYSQFWTSQANQVLVKKLTTISNQTIAPIFGSVFVVSLVVTVVGLLFFILSMVASNKEA